MVGDSSTLNSALHRRIALLKKEQETIFHQQDLPATEKVKRYLRLYEMLQELESQLSASASHEP